MSSQVDVYEAKLLTEKNIPLSDANYLYGLEDRLLKGYKKFPHPFLKLNEASVPKRDEIEELTNKVRNLEVEVDIWKSKAIETKLDMNAMKLKRADTIKKLNELEEAVERLIKKS